MKANTMAVSESARSGAGRRVFASCLLGGCLAILAGLSTSLAQAATVEITAVFSPDPNNPQVNRFKNTTPNSGVCLSYPHLCTPNGYFSISLPGLQAISQTAILASHANVRNGAMFKVPAEPQPVQVTSASGEVAKVLFSISALSGTNRTRDVRLLTNQPGFSVSQAQNELWGGNQWGWSSPTDCPRAVGMGATYIDANFLWFTPKSVPCGLSPAYEIDSLSMRNISVSYLMTSPDPLSMGSGIYRGSINYTVGPGGDFDFGDNLAPTYNIVTMNFTLSVEHTLKLQFPPGYGSVVLNPAGG